MAKRFLLKKRSSEITPNNSESKHTDISTRISHEFTIYNTRTTRTTSSNTKTTIFALRLTFKDLKKSTIKIKSSRPLTLTSNMKRFFA